MQLICLALAFSTIQGDSEIAPGWILQLEAEFKAVGLLVGYPDGLGHGIHRVSRYESAVALYATVRSVDSCLTELEQRPGRLTVEILPFFVEFQPRWKELTKAVTTLKRELDSLEADTPALLTLTSGFKARVGSLWFKHDAPKLGYPSFTDVPKGHWAARSISHLKAVGVLNGYPDGTFSGAAKD
ncbi:MAG: S-layer homology domain-containing protein [Fimbriimonas sp.]